MKIVTSMGFFGDQVGERISITYSEVDETGKVISDNNKLDRVVLDSEALAHIGAIKDFAHGLIDE